MKNETGLRAVAYSRVSTGRQADKELSIPSQNRAAHEHAEKNGWTFVESFSEKGETGRNANRPEFQRMIQQVKEKDRPFDIIIIWDSSRFTRNLEDALTFKGLLKKHGVKLVSITENFDESPIGKLLEHIIDVFNEFYSDLLGESTFRGMKEAATNGKNVGGATPIGYQMDDDRQLVEDSDFAPVIRRIFKLYVEGKGAKGIASTFNREGILTNSGRKWQTQRILNILRNRKYAGMHVWNKGEPDEVCIPDNHPAIIDVDTFNRVQEMLKTNSPSVSHPREVTSQYILSGLIYCKKCGGKMVGSSAKSGAYSYYECSAKLKGGKAVCDAKPVKKELLEREFFRILKLTLFSEENIRLLAKQTNEQLSANKNDMGESIKSCQRTISKLNRERDSLHRKISEGKYRDEDLAPRLRELNEQIQSQEAKLPALQVAQADHKEQTITLPEVVGYVGKLRTLLDSASNSEKKALLRSFVEKVAVNRPEVEISYKLPSPKRNRENSPAESSPYDMKWLPEQDSNLRQSG